MMYFIHLGGPVLWCILAVSVAVVFLVGQRALTVHRASLRGRDFLKGIINNIQRGNIMEAVALCEDAPGPVPELTRVAILEHQRGGLRTRQAMEEVGVYEIARLEKNLPLLLAFAQVAPILGLLGTVVGMWDMLVALHQQAPLVQAGDLGAGLSRALVTTIVGLGTGAVGYVGHAYIVSRVNAIVLSMEQAYTEILQALASLPTPEPRS